MGTRNLICVKLSNEFKVAQYGQWDGYPTGQGIGIARFLKNTFNKEVFTEAISECKFVSKEKDITDGRSFDRDLGANILEMIQTQGVRELANSIEFVKDSLFCEWAYVIDLDKEEIRVFKGFNTSPLPNDAEFYFDGTVNDDGYFPIQRIASYKFNEFTEEAMQQLEGESR